MLQVKTCSHFFFQAHFFSPKVLQHYCLIWLSIITSPKGKQLDFWLFFAVFMDCAPVVISIYNTINYALWLRNMGKNIYNFICLIDQQKIGRKQNILLESSFQRIQYYQISLDLQPNLTHSFKS